MGYQFIHVNAYARTAGKGKEGGHSVRSILAEAKREEKAMPHVSKPKQPTILYGNLDLVEPLAFAYAENAKDDLGRKLRVDGLCLAAGVVSVADDMSSEHWQLYKYATLQFLKNEFGERLKAVAEHVDENHRHLHFYAIPTDGEHFDDIISGRKAARLAKKNGLSKGDQNTAYKAAMREFQQRFFKSVSLGFGLTRFGPHRRRLNRAGWRQEREQAKTYAAELNKLKSQLAKEQEAKNKAFATAQRAVAFACSQKDKYEKEIWRLEQQINIPPIP